MPKVPIHSPASGAIAQANAGRWQGRRIGLLGGSFNPAHAGHLHISREALKQLGLDAVWWLVSPQNPLKAAAGMAPLAARLASAQAMARDPRVVPCAIETQLGTQFTIDTLVALQRLHPCARFIWLIGSDNLAQLHRWKRWPEMLDRVAIAVLDRRGYDQSRWSAPVLARRRAHVMNGWRIRSWYKRALPAILLVTLARSGLSATAIRRLAPDWARQLGSTART